MSIYKKALDHFGAKNQIDMCIEEMSELTKALCKVKRYGFWPQYNKNVYEEIADVQIMINQMAELFDKGEIRKQMDLKLERLEERMMTYQ